MTCFGQMCAAPAVAALEAIAATQPQLIITELSFDDDDLSYVVKKIHAVK